MNWLAAGVAETVCFLSDKDGGLEVGSKRLGCWRTDAAMAVAAPTVATRSTEAGDDSASLVRLPAGETLLFGGSTSIRSTLVSI